MTSDALRVGRSLATAGGQAFLVAAGIPAVADVLLYCKTTHRLADW
jgi:hypothetical protein